MKTFKIIIIAAALFFTTAMQAQVSVSVHLPSPPMWGPAGYSGIQYYYLPDVESYYDIQTSMFIYYSGGAWIRRASLPSRYRNYDLYGGYKVVMTGYHGNTPYTEFNHHKKLYARGYHGQQQKTIGAKPGKGNSNTGYNHNNNRGNQGVKHNNNNTNQGNHNTAKQGNHNQGNQGNNNKKNDQGHGNGKGKK